MSRRSTPQAKTDDVAFPIRVKFRVPSGGFGGSLDEPLAWLRANLDPFDHAKHSAQTTGGDAIAFYFRNIESARRFLDAFPQFELADGVTSVAYARHGSKHPSLYSK